MWLRLFHGRQNPAQAMEDWGSDGPTFGPLRYVHTTYGTMLHCCFRDPAMAQLVGVDDAERDPVLWLPIVDGMVFHNNVYYGDWTVYLDPADA